MPNTINIKRCIRKEPTTREDFLLKKLERAGLLQRREKRVYKLPKAPGVFSLGPDREPVQVPNDEVVQPVTKDLDITKLNTMKTNLADLF